MAHIAISNEETKKLQIISLKMLAFFDEFCKKNDLVYFLCGGCCIGAVRHNGFVPWDDDVDVFMPRDDYNKLKKLWHDTDQYEIQITSPEFRGHSPAICICDKKTTFVKSFRKDMDVSQGVALDVFPIDGCPNGIKRKMQKLWALLFSLYTVEIVPKNHGTFVSFICKVLLACVPSWKMRCKIWQLCEKNMSKYCIADYDKITELCAGPGYMQNEYPASAFEYAIMHKFENGEFPIPCGYDDYLTMAFGDYMQLPPKDQRIAHHEYEFIDLDNSYLKYKGSKYLKGKN